MGHISIAAWRLLIRAAFMLLVFSSVSGCIAPKILRVEGLKEVRHEEFLDEIAARDMVFVGEVHNRKSHHRAQLELIKALVAKGHKVVIGVEMFRKDNQEALDRWVAGELMESEFREVYHRNWGVSWNQYREIFLYARDNRVPVVGLNIARSVIRQVVKGGFASLTPEQLAGLPPGIECRVDKTYEDFIKEALGEHVREMSFKNFCEAQMVWDNVMAHTAIEYLKANPGSSFVVLAGSAHSWKRGIPAQVKRLSDYSYTVILPESDDVRVDTIDPEDADYIITGWFF